jgi:TRAP-type C4-dicarboxylate transport system substrate-binding protein
VKRTVTFLVFVIVALGLVCIYHPQPASAQDKGKVITLKFNDWGPPGIGIGKLHQQAAKMIEEKTQGRVKVNNYFSQSLLKYPETFRGVGNGIADISLYAIQPEHDVTMILSLPFTGLPGMMKTAKIFNEMVKRYPEFNQEFEKRGAKWISIRAMPPNHFHMVKKVIRTPQDMKGVRLIGDPKLSEELKKMNAAAIQMGPPDWYSSLERGVADGMLTHYPAVYDFKLLELLKTHTHLGDGAAGAVPIGFVVNIKSWNKLPPDIQKVIVEVYDWVNEESLKYDEGVIEKAIAEARKDGHQVIDLTPAEVQVWLDWAKPSHERELARIEAKGWPAKRIYEGYMKLIKEYK